MMYEANTSTTLPLGDGISVTLRWNPFVLSGGPAGQCLWKMLLFWLRWGFLRNSLIIFSRVAGRHGSSSEEFESPGIVDFSIREEELEEGNDLCDFHRAHERRQTLVHLWAAHQDLISYL